MARGGVWREAACRAGVRWACEPKSCLSPRNVSDTNSEAPRQNRKGTRERRRGQMGQVCEVANRGFLDRGRRLLAPTPDCGTVAVADTRARSHGAKVSLDLEVRSPNLQGPFPNPVHDVKRDLEGAGAMA